jgi:pyruvate dehydrogenase (quinone)
VVAIVGQSARPVIGGDYQQEVDLQSLFKDVAGDYVYTASSPAQIRHLVDRAMRFAKSLRTVACIIIPKDIQDEPAVELPAQAHDRIQSGRDFSSPRVLPRATDLRRAANLLNAGKRVAILVGSGARDAADELVDVADTLGAGAAKALLGKAVLPDDLPWVTGCIGLLGTGPSSDMMRSCDTLLMIGTSFPFAEFLPKPGTVRAVQIDLDPRALAAHYPVDVALVGDSAETLRALLPLLQRKSDRQWRARIEGWVAGWWRLMSARAMQSAEPLNPELVFHELSPRLPDGCIISGDAGTVVSWFARHLKMRRGMQASLSGRLASMGSAVPYAVAAKFAYPDLPAIALAGDGAMQMNGINEIISVAKYWRRWLNPQLIVLVLNNRELSFVSWEMRASGEPKFEASQDIPDFPYAQYAQSLGLAGVKVERPEDVGAAWDFAFSQDRPVIYEARTDPNVAPLPPHVSFTEARNFIATLAKGDPEELGIVKQSIKTMLSGFRRRDKE